MSSKVTALVKQTLKRKHKAVRLALLRKCYSFGPHELLAALDRVGINSGDAVLVHSSFDQFAGFTGKATDVIAVLQQSVGSNGHVLMPTIPFSGTAVQYVAQGQVFDVRRTPSQMGLLSELFRRQHGIVRSVHPTHSVAVAGPLADEWISDHHLAATPCGKGTPYARLGEAGGKMLFMGTGIGVMTFFHFVEDELESHMPFPPFTEEIFELRSKDWRGNELATHTRLFNPIYSRKRNLDVLATALKREGHWRETKVGRLGLVLLSAQDVRLTCRQLASRGIYCYDL